VREGDVTNEIEDYCTKVNPYAIVIGAESASALERFLAMGETVRLLQHLHWPLIIVPPSANFKGIRKIGFACDFRRVLESVSVQELRALVETFDAELHVLHVSEEDSNGYSPDTIMESGWLQEMLGALRPKYHFIRDADIEKGINDFAEQNKLDLLIIIPKKHNLISRIFRHSHSKRTVLHAHVPVMAIHE
jgi:nucleotide-binding universal stress UspA family protein